jgi:hypothetical protein
MIKNWIKRIIAGWKAGYAIYKDPSACCGAAVKKTTKKQTVKK